MKNSTIRQRWVKRRWWIIVAAISSVFIVRVICEYRVSKLPPKERQLRDAHSRFEIASLKYRWGSGIADGVMLVTGPIAKVSQFTEYLANQKNKASRELRDATFIADNELIEVFTDQEVAGMAFGKLVLRNFRAPLNLKVTKYISGTLQVAESELWVPTQYVQEVRKVISETQIHIVKTFDVWSPIKESSVMECLHSAGIKVFAIPTIPNPSKPRSLMVLAEDKEIAEQALEALTQVGPPFEFR